MGNSSVTPWSSARNIVCQIFRFIGFLILMQRGKDLSLGDALPSLADATASSPSKGKHQRRWGQVDGHAPVTAVIARCHPSVLASEVSILPPTRCTSDYLLADFGRVTRAATTEIAARMKKATACVGCEASGGVVVSG